MKTLVFICLVYSLPYVAIGQIVNGDFDFWEGEEVFARPIDWILTDNIQKGILEKEYRNDSGSTVLRINPGYNHICSNNVSQLVDISYLSTNQKSSVYISAKVLAESNNPKARFSIESYFADTTFIEYIEKRVAWNTNDYEEFKIGDIHPDAEKIYIYMHSGGRRVDNECIETTTMWVDRVYIKSKEINADNNAPTLIKTFNGFRIEGIEHKQFEYSIFSIDGKFIAGDELSEDEIDILTNGIYILTLVDTISNKHYSFKIVHIAY